MIRRSSPYGIMPASSPKKRSISKFGFMNKGGKGIKLPKPFNQAKANQRRRNNTLQSLKNHKEHRAQEIRARTNLTNNEIKQLLNKLNFLYNSS